MSWALVLAATSAASGLFNAYDEYHANRRIRRDLEKIQEYLIGLRQAVADIQRQNTQILNKLDQLPDQIRQIVTEVVDVALLTERYSVVNDIRDNFLILRGGRAYSLRSTEWLTFSSAMGYLFDHEYRISKVFDLINVCEIALVITKERSLWLVTHRLDEKIKAITLLHDDLTNLIYRKLLKLKIDLDNNTFIQSHNLSEHLPAFDQLVYTKQPDRQITESYVEQECETHLVGRYDRPVRVCRDVHRTRQVADTAFHNARDAHVSEIDEQVLSIRENFSNLAALTEAIGVLKRYRDRISSGIDIENLYQNSRMYFTDEQALSTFSAERHRVETLPLANADDFSDYTDGCDGDCTKIDPFRIQETNKIFFREPIC